MVSGRAAENRTIRAADQARRREVIEAASDLFLRDGFVATTTDAIATRAGMSKKTLYRLFASKYALFEELVRAKLFELDDARPGPGRRRAEPVDVDKPSQKSPRRPASPAGGCLAAARPIRSAA